MSRGGVAKRLAMAASAVLAAVVLSLACAQSAFASQFVDVPDDHWAQEQGVIDEAVEQGLVKGSVVDGAAYFRPEAGVTRAEVATMLCRMAGVSTEAPYPANSTPFADVPDGEWFTGPINWAFENGVLNGSDGRVRPGDPITRQELCQVLGNYARGVLQQATQSDRDRLGKYPDVSSVASWAAENVSYCVERGIIGSAGNLNPEGGATRAEAAKMVLVFSKGGTAAPALLKSHFIDVGQGDSTFIELPDGKTMLIDAGTARAGSAVVSYIKGLGYSYLDYVVMTHPDADHIGGMAQVLQSFSVGSLYAPNCSSNTKTWENLLDVIAARGLSVNSVDKLIGYSVDSGFDGSLVFLSPSVIGSDSNDNSAVLDARYGRTRFLYTGDASSDVLRRAVSGHVDVLKVSHHGSSTGTDADLVSRLSPSRAVISCGAGNSYGHPTDGVLAALSSASVYRTDLQGTVTCFSDGTTTWANVGAVPPYVPEPEPAPDPEPEPEPEPDPGPDLSTTVCVTKTGTKYHLDWCPSLSRSKNLRYMSAAEARAKGYEPCKNCRPPA